MSVASTLVRRSVEETRLVARGRAAFAVKFPGQDFDGPVWSMKHLKRVGASSGNVNVRFMRIAEGKAHEPQTARYAAVMKSILGIHALKTGTISYYEYALRWLWEAILDRRGGEAETFSWQGFRIADAERAEELMLAAGLARSTVYKTCIYINAILEKVAAEGVITPKRVVFRTPRVEAHSRHTLAGQDERQSLLPSPEGIAAVADLYRGEYEVTEFEELVLCAVAIMFATGIRIQELLELREDALVYEGDRAYLRFLLAKHAGLEEERIVLSQKQAALVSDAISRAKMLTRPQRAQAKRLAADPTSVALPRKYAGYRAFSLEEVSEILGIAVESESQVCKLMRLPKPLRGQKVSVIQLVDFLQRMREDRCPESISGLAGAGPSSIVPIHKALFLSFLNGAHSRRGSWPLLVHVLRYQHVHDLLVGRKGAVQSIFARHGMYEKDGSAIAINPHAFRHNVSTQASAAGIADSFIARWQRRVHHGDLQSYLHLTRSEQLARLRTAIREDRMQGEVVDMYRMLAPTDREMFLEGVVQAVHVTPLGLCVHDFNTAPCPRSMNCVRRCGSFLWDPNDDAERAQFVQLHRRNVRALDDAKNAARTGNGTLADQWVRDLEETIQCLDEILSTPAGDNRQLRPIFPSAPSHFKPLD